MKELVLEEPRGVFLAWFGRSSREEESDIGCDPTEIQGRNTRKDAKEENESERGEREGGERGKREMT